MLDGNGAASEAMRLSRIQVVSAYPITPQSPISEKLADFVADGSLNAKYIRVESEHTAMSCAIGAQLTGVRAGTATSSVGLALMHEIVNVASGLRVPIVMPVVNRSLAAPWSLWCDHQDSMAERDSGWIQFYVENCQEVIDFILMAYHAAEHPEVLTPAMVCLDGFFLSHTTEAVLLPDQEEADAFLPPYVNDNLRIDPENPFFINNLCPTSDYTEMRYQQHIGFGKSKEVIPEVMKKFEKHFGRKYSMIEGYKLEDADAAILGLGSQAGTIRYVVDQYREQGKKVGMVKMSTFRPFPMRELTTLLRHVPNVGVIDRSASLGAAANPVCTEVRSALAGCGETKPVAGFLAGLAGRDIRPETIGTVFDALLKGDYSLEPIWIDVAPNAMTLREVK